MGQQRNSDNTWHKEKRSSVWKHQSRQHLSLDTHLWVICATSLPKSVTQNEQGAHSHTCPDSRCSSHCAPPSTVCLLPLKLGLMRASYPDVRPISLSRKSDGEGGLDALLGSFISLQSTDLPVTGQPNLDVLMFSVYFGGFFGFSIFNTSNFPSGKVWPNLLESL